MVRVRSICSCTSALCGTVIDDPLDQIAKGDSGRHFWALLSLRSHLP